MKTKKLFNSICLTFVLIGALIGGLFLSGEKNFISSDAAFTEYTEITNNLPEYLNREGGIARTSDDSIILLDATTNNTFSLSIAADENDKITGTGENTDKQNYSYKISDTEYYYFNFTNALSLYKDVTNQQDYTNQANLLGTTSIENFASPHTNAFPVDGLSVPPQKLNVNFKIGPTFSVDTQNQQKIITLEEGLYTLVIPMTRWYTNDGGLTYTTDSSDTVQIEYTFMIFNSSTYFNSTTGLQNATMSNTENVTLTNNSGYSMFYYYNYTSTSLPKFSYNPYVYQITVNFTDYNQNSFYRKVEYNGSGFDIKDSNGDLVSEGEEYIMTGYNDDNGQAYITFNELGSYDISFEYLYRVEDSNEIFELPFDQLQSDSSLIQYNKAQRLYIYGYQTMYTNFNEPVDSATNQRQSRELKTISEDKTTFEQSADITALFMADGSAPAQHSSSQYAIRNGSNNLQSAVQAFLQKDNAPSPVTTNQVPIRFLSNVNLKTGTGTGNENAASWIFSVSGSGTSLTLASSSAFTNENQNTPGTYVYIIQYQFDSYLGEGGVQQSAYYHYQIFYFQITNETPAVTVVDENGNNFSTTRYTNKSVYLINESTDSPYNADVTIEVNIYNYVTRQSQTIGFQNLASYDKSTYTYFASLSSDEAGLSAHQGKEAVHIDSESANANRRFTISYRSTMTSNNSYTFTIDTDEISFASPRLAEEGSDGSYSLGRDITEPTTNSPFAFAWNEKASGATTRGYVKYFPLKAIDYYNNKNITSNLQLLLNQLLTIGVVPVSYKIDFANSSAWSPISTNAYGLSTIAGTSVKTDAGLYLIEVYDIAGNVGYDIFVLDNTEPRFIKITEADTTSLEILSASDVIAVSDATVSINWGDYKGIILQNSTESTFKDITPYEYANLIVDSKVAREALENTLTTYTNVATNSNIRYLSQLSSFGDVDTGLPYASNYLVIEIDDNFAVKDNDSDNFTLQSGNSFTLELMSDGVANEGTYQFLVRDASNTRSGGNALSSLQSFPSAILSVTVTSDSSRLFITDEEGNILTQAGFSLTGTFYTNEAKNAFSKIADENAGITILSNRTYRYAYYSPITNDASINLSYVPFASDGSTVALITLKHYEYKPVIESGNVAYYDIDMANPSSSITVFDINQTPSGVSGAEQTFQIALGTSEYPLAGRYVITRIYQTQSGDNIYDYYERTITIDIDPYNLITPIEPVTENSEDGTSTSKSWYESLVGGEIVLSMYSGAEQSSIQVSFPFNQDGDVSDSFYNGEWAEGQENQIPTISVEGSKLPMSLNIPQYKYTTKASYNGDDNSFSVDENNNLSYYGNAYIEPQGNLENPSSYIVYVENIPVETFESYDDAVDYLNSASITPYEVLAVVEFTETNGQTQYYSTNGTTNNGYLVFYNASMDGVDDGGFPTIVSDEKAGPFYQAGTYIVTLYQASNQASTSSFRKFYKFAFEITSQAPEAEVINASTGEILTEVTKNTLNNITTVEYYANSNSLRFEWEVPTSEYLAKIDEGSISVVYHSSASDSMGSKIDDFTISGTNTRSFNLDLKESQITSAGAYLSVTMQFEGHDNRYYHQLQIIVRFDTTAPTENLQTLISNYAKSTSEQFDSNYLWANARENYTFSESSTNGSDSDAVAYSYTPSAGNYRGFAFTVTGDFFTTTLNNTLSSATFNGTQEVYYRSIGETDNETDNYLQSFVSATTKDTFVPSAFIQYDNNPPSAPEGYGVYEIVEIDAAGNMVTYLVNYIDSENLNNAMTFERLSSSDNTLTTTVADAQILQGANFYSGTGMSITSLDYQNNPWGFYSVTLNDGATSHYMLSPALSDNQIYQVSELNGQKVLSAVNLSQVFPASIASSSTKHSMVFGDSLSGQTHRVYMTIMNANLITNTISGNENQAILEITVPTSAQVASTTIGHVYPVSIEVYQFVNGNWQTSPLFASSQTEASYGTWTPSTSVDGNITISTISSASSDILRITVNIGSNTKIRYNITDNFGNEITIIQIANEPSFNEITGGNYVYTIEQGGNDTLYLADQSLTFSYNTQLYGSVIEAYINNAWQPYGGFTESTSNYIRSMTFTSSAVTYNDVYRISIYDAEDDEHAEPLRTVYLKLYNALPEYSETRNTANINHNYLQMRDRNGEVLTGGITMPGQSVSFRGQLLTANALSFTTYSQNVTLSFTDGQALVSSSDTFNQFSTLGYSVYLYDEANNDWINLNEFYEGYQFSGPGQYTILVKYDDGQFSEENFFTNMCKLFYLEILDSSTIYYHITVDGVEVEKSEILYTNSSGRTFESTYIVGVSYDDNSRVNIAWNEDEELGLTYSITAQYSVADGVYVEEYSYNCTTSSGYFAIIYIAPSTNFVTTLSYEDSTGSLAQIEGNSLSVYATEAETNFDRLKINFRSYYGISQNRVNVRVEKYVNGSYMAIDVATYSSTSELSYFYLDRAGSYRIYFEDSCEPANTHMFGNNSYLTVTFISEVPFFISYEVDTGEVDESGQPITETYVGEKVQRAVYNHPVTINLYNISNYFQGYPTIAVRRNGQTMTISNPNATSYTFSDPGYYSISFSAISRENGTAIRQNEYNFTIINSEESRYAYSFANYQNYYVKSIVRDGVDITQSLMDLTDFDTIVIDGSRYLSEFVLSFGDEQTGAGRYQITISSNQSALGSILQEDFTFDVWINSATPPLTISVAEGGSTSGTITVTLNVQNFYNAIGDSYIVVGQNTYQFNSSTLSSYGEVATFEINTTGTWYIQVYSASGNLLYSYKVYRTEPLNVFSIIAIVIAVIVLIIIIIITIRLRKRQRVK